ncbi:hypothetical protein [Rhodococcus koreensis]
MFSYGTLRVREVQVPMFGREWAAGDGAIAGVSAREVVITDPVVITPQRQ